MGIGRMDTEEIYSNVLLISIANKCSINRLIEAAEEETERYITNHKKKSTGLSDGLPKGFSGIYFIESLARKVGSSLGEAYFLTEDRKERIIADLLRNIDPIKEAYSEYYDDSVEGQVEFEGKVQVIDLSDINQVRQFYCNKESEDGVTNNCLLVPYFVTFQRVLK